MSYGAFGKIPALGDFFRFDLMPGFVGIWDHWLQSGIQAARLKLGPGWQDSYMSAPIWRFTLAAGLAGPAAMTGVLMASVDRVGRQFPLTLAGPLPPNSDPIAQHLSSGPAFEALEHAALSMLEDGAAQAALQLALAGVPASDLPAAMSVREAPGLIRLTAAYPSVALASHLAQQRFARPAIFTALLPEGQALILSDGLPPPDRFYQLIDSHGLIEVPR